MERTIVQFKISKGETHFVAECVDLPIVTQGRTLDEVAKNINEAVGLYLEGEEMKQFGIVKNPSVLVNFEINQAYA
ncbi:MAG: hypothetical protein LiPW41_370 [Parcubacteria group bacterium LiPW_41]|nr:MAG: hypothetical protein LiPW41_370 [Parcubacteria group bacterium LiPW_41]